MIQILSKWYWGKTLWEVMFDGTILEELKETGIRKENIIYLQLDTRAFRSIKAANQLDALIEEKSVAEGVKCLLVDEIQNATGFEEACCSARFPVCTAGNAGRSNGGNVKE